MVKKFISIPNTIATSLLVLLTSSSAFAQVATPPPPGIGDLLARMLPMLIMVFFIFYFMVIKPQQQKLKAHEDMIKGLKKGDRVATAGGILGRVSDIAEDAITLEIAQNVKVKFTPSKITKKIENTESLKNAA
ncbi:MAG: preprotein translocase subunit YajC [bacterium]|nr:preprotein translocase subunit YajC [bacterium]